MPTGSTIRSARTNEVMSASTETVATSGSSYARGVELSTRQRRTIVRRSLLTLLGILIGFLLGAWAVSWWNTEPLNRNQLQFSKNRKGTGRSSFPMGNPANSDSESRASLATGTVLSGGGSTFIRPAIEHWASVYEAQTGIKIKYSAVGSSKGVEALFSNFVDFGCTDAFLSDQSLAKAGTAVVHIPLVLGAVVPAYNLTFESGEPIPLRFTGAVLAGIYLGKIKKWNDPGIAVSNLGVELPDHDITVIYRGDGSGTTAIWTDFLSKSNSTWKTQVGAGNEVQWPVGIAVDKSDGVANAVSRMSGAIGYVELNYALANGLPIGLVKNQSGAFVEPSVDTITAAAQASVRTIPDDLRFSLTDSAGPNSYPITGACWAVFRTDQLGNHGRELIRFLRWVTTEGQVHVTNLQYGRLPEELIGKIAAILDQISPENQ